MNDRRSLLQGLSFTLFLVALPLVSFGAMHERALFWQLGLLCLVVAGLLPIVAHFLKEEDDGQANQHG